MSEFINTIEYIKSIAKINQYTIKDLLISIDNIIRHNKDSNILKTSVTIILNSNNIIHIKTPIITSQVYAISTQIYHNRIDNMIAHDRFRVFIHAKNVKLILNIDVRNVLIIEINREQLQMLTNDGIKSYTKNKTYNLHNELIMLKLIIDKICPNK